MKEWIKYNGAEQLPKIEIRNIVRFKLSDGFTYRVKAVVDVVEKDIIEATIEGIYDWGANVKIGTGSDILMLEGKPVKLGNDYVHPVKP